MEKVYHLAQREILPDRGGLSFTTSHGGSVCVWVGLLAFSCDYVCFCCRLSHCSGLSNTESGRTEILSFFSGQLYSFGSLVCMKRECADFNNRSAEKDKRNTTGIGVAFTDLFTVTQVMYISEHLLDKLFSQQYLQTENDWFKHTRRNFMSTPTTNQSVPGARGRGLRTGALQ